MKTAQQSVRMSSSFQAILVDKEPKYRTRLLNIVDEDLPHGDVDVDVHYSSLNYKDALAITGKGPVVRKFPMVPGIDISGTVTGSRSDRFQPGDQVVLNGFGVGEQHWGGLCQKARLSADWLIKLPSSLSPKQAMAVGTAGYTAMLCVIALEKNGVTPDKGEVLVTGANGGVGSISIALLSKLGYTVVGSTGRVKESAYLEELGCSRVVDRNELSKPGRPLGKELYAGAIDSVGSHTLANACASMKYGGTVAACGLAQGLDLEHTVAPFILRGVTLAGIDSVMRPLADRVVAWDRLAGLLDEKHLDSICTEVSLSEAIDSASQLLKGKIRGRVIVKCQ